MITTIKGRIIYGLTSVTMFTLAPAVTSILAISVCPRSAAHHNAVRPNFGLSSVIHSTATPNDNQLRNERLIPLGSMLFTYFTIAFLPNYCTLITLSSPKPLLVFVGWAVGRWAVGSMQLAVGSGRTIGGAAGVRRMSCGVRDFKIAFTSLVHI